MKRHVFPMLFIALVLGAVPTVATDAAEGIPPQKIVVQVSTAAALAW